MRIVVGAKVDEPLKSGAAVDEVFVERDILYAPKVSKAKSPAIDIARICQSANFRRCED